MNEIKSIQLQLERQVVVLSSRIENLYSSLEELNRLTKILFKLTPLDNDSISKWLKEEEFSCDEDGYFKSEKRYQEYLNDSVCKDTLSYFWTSSMKGDLVLRHRFYALRDMGKILQEMREKLDGVGTIYFQDIIKNACLGLPFMHMADIIPSTFNWNEYHSCISVNPKNNPKREILWSVPNIDYGGTGLISIISIPLYEENIFIGVWSIDVPFETLHQQCILDTFIPNQTNFITDFEGNIVAHPTIETKIDKAKGSFYQINIKELSDGFKDLDLQNIIALKKGEIEIVDERSQAQVVLFHIIPKIQWIMFATFPKDTIFESVRDKITDAFNTMKDKTLPKKIDLHVDSNMQILVDSYNDMIKVLSYNQEEKEKAQQKAFEVQKLLNEELEKLVAKRTQELEDLNKELEYLANIDSLTQLYNRRHFFTLVNTFLDMIARKKEDSTVLLIDIDKFKDINDTYGHDIGDKVLISFANVLSKNIRKGDIFARFGGEEFIVFLPNTNLDDAIIVAQKIRTAIYSYRGVEDIKFTISIGVAKFIDEIDNTIKQADIALYRAKENGRNRIECIICTS